MTLQVIDNEVLTSIKILLTCAMNVNRADWQVVSN